MEIFETVPKMWGNSIGITLPSEIVREENIHLKEKITVMIIGKSQENVQKAFGTLKLKKPTQQVMQEIDEGYDEH